MAAISSNKYLRQPEKKAIMPARRDQVKRKAAHLKVPQPGEDAAERKRVLNVLAQRRYRQRRREHIEQLEAQAANASASSSASDAQSSPTMDVQLQDSRPTTVDVPMCHLSFAATEYFDQTPFQIGDQTYTTDKSSEGDVLAGEPDLLATSNAAAIALSSDDNQCLWDTSVLLPSLPSTPPSMSGSGSGTSSSNESESWSLMSRPADASHAEPMHGEGLELQYSFPDEAHLEMAELTLLRGCMAIATRMNVQDIIWSLTSTSPFTDSSMALAEFHHLPINLQPTMLQLTIPHHPVIDLLPWPSARDNMIKVLSVPPECRPPGAASPMALLDFVYDLEDSAEGVRISGNDPYSGHNWEVGEKVFKSWWWIFNRDIIRRSNELRASRGAPLLGSGSIVGEVS